MLWSFAHLFRAATEDLFNIEVALITDDVSELTEDHSKHVRSSLDFLSKLGGVVNLEGTKHLCDDLAADVKAGMKVAELEAKIESIQSLLRKELKDRKFLYVPKERAEYYKNKALCGASVAEKFPDALPEIIEAGNCYALDRPTACVFHLMRVIPYGMAAVAKLLGVKYSQPIRSLDWNAIIQPIEKKIGEIQKSARTPKKIRDMKDFSEIAQHFNFCKDAWRNHVSHSIERYDMPQARSVMDHVGLVMQLISKRLKKPFTGLR